MNGPVVAEPAGPGLAIESATAHVEVAVYDARGTLAGRCAEDVGHGHTKRVAALVAQAMDAAAVRPASLAWVAAGLGPGSFTGVRVGLATAQALAMVSGARVFGATTLASLAHAAPAAGVRRALVVPLVGAGRRDVYAGFFRSDTRGIVHLLAAPFVGTPERLLERVAEALALLPGSRLWFVGPGAGRERERLEAAHPGSTSPAHGHDGPSAEDLARAARLAEGPGAGLPEPGREAEPVYVRSAQAEEKVRHAVNARHPVTLRAFLPDDVEAAAEIERLVFSDPWPASFFRGELATRGMWARIAEREGQLAGYSLAWLGDGVGHLGNIAVVPGQRRRGVARALLDDLFAEAARRAVGEITLEVRVSNDGAQDLYRAYGFRLAGLRRGYYRDTGEDALLMTWRAPRT